MTFWHAVQIVSLFAFAVALWLLAAGGVRHFIKDNAHWSGVDTIVWLIVVAIAIASSSWALVLVA